MFLFNCYIKLNNEHYKNKKILKDEMIDLFLKN